MSSFIIVKHNLTSDEISVYDLSLFISMVVFFHKYCLKMIFLELFIQIHPYILNSMSFSSTQFNYSPLKWRQVQAARSQSKEV